MLCCFHFCFSLISSASTFHPFRDHRERQAQWVSVAIQDLQVHQASRDCLVPQERKAPRGILDPQEDLEKMVPQD